MYIKESLILDLKANNISLEVSNLFRKLMVFLTQHLHYSETDSLLFLLLCT